MGLSLEFQHFRKLFDLQMNDTVYLSIIALFINQEDYYLYFGKTLLPFLGQFGISSR